MPGMGGGYGTPAAPPQVAPGSQPGSSQAGSIVMGSLGGRAFEYSDERGLAAPPDHVSTAGKVLGYEDNDDDLDALAYFIADLTDADGASVDFGPLFEPDVELTLDKWFPSSDWTLGLTVHITDSSESGSGASGQWNVLAGRDRTDPYKFNLLHPFATAPEAGDVFEIGSLCWIVYPNIAAPPMKALLAIHKGELIMKLLSGSLRGGIEVYTSGNKFQLGNGLYPYLPDAIRGMEYAQADIENLSHWNWNVANPSGKGAISRELAVAFRTIVRGGRDFKVDSVNYYVNLIDFIKG